MDISPSGIIGTPHVGDFLPLYCTVITVDGVESSLIIFSWVGPDGNTITNNSRILNPTSSVNNTHTGSIQFTYLMEGDNGTYTCNVMILETNGTVSVELGPLTS